jgi:5-methylcytosine-specific restriction endonuclease McrA
MALVVTGTQPIGGHQWKEIAVQLHQAAAVRSDEICAAHDVPVALRSLIVALARADDPEQARTELVAQLTAVRLTPILRKLQQVAAQREQEQTDARTRLRHVCAGGCQRKLPIAQLTMPSSEAPPGAHGPFCDSCWQRIQAENQRRLARRGINSARSRARAAHLPATLTEVQWAATLAHFADECAYCGGVWYVVEHVWPLEQGGGTAWNNCVPSCYGCNARKRGTSVGASAARFERIATWLATRAKALRLPLAERVDHRAVQQELERLRPVPATTRDDAPFQLTAALDGGALDGGGDE